MSTFENGTRMPVLALWGDTVRARQIVGERITLAVVEIDPDSTVPVHQHEAEQVGIVVRGDVEITIAGQTRAVSVGGGWRILSGLPHGVTAGPDGAVVIEAFNPVRTDWEGLPVIDGSTFGWPE
jgi:unsaturated pyranuronate lyase